MGSFMNEMYGLSYLSTFSLIFYYFLVIDLVTGQHLREGILVSRDGRIDKKIMFYGL